MAKDHLNVRKRTSAEIWEETVEDGQSHHMMDLLFCSKILPDLRVEGVSRERFRKMGGNPSGLIALIEAVMLGEVEVDPFRRQITARGKTISF